MSTKFEQLIVYLENEEIDKANELFHEIVVETSREIYENLISEEAEEDEEMDEAREEDEEEMDESKEEDEEEMDESADEEMDESDMDLEDSYVMDGDEEADDEMGGDATDDMLGDVEVDDEEGGSDDAMMDIKNAIAELEAAFAELEAGQDGGDDMEADFGDEDEMGDEEGEDDMMGLREYRETVGNDWEKNSQKTQNQIVGANTGEKMPSASDSKSPISSGSGKPTSGANAKNILGGKGGQEGGSNTGTSPNKPTKGINPESGEKFAKGIHNVDGAKSGVKTLTKVAGGHGAEKKSSGEGHAVGAGTGENSVKGATNTKSIVDKKIG